MCSLIDIPVFFPTVDGAWNETDAEGIGYTPPSAVHTTASGFAERRSGQTDDMVAVDATAYRVVVALAGLAFLLAAWVPAWTARRPLSLPMVLVSVGAAVFALPIMPDVDPRNHLELTEHLAEFGVLIALLGAGLKIDRPLGLRRWAPTWRLLGVVMPVTIAGTALLGWVGGLAPAAALLLGAVLAPTDPVLAADVQVGEPSVGEEVTETPSPTEWPDEDAVRFSLTSEAGLNDGLAFPFVWAAIALATSGGIGWFGEWMLMDVVGRITIGIAVGWVVGRVLGRVSFSPPGNLVALADAGDGFVALAATGVAYGLAELAHGYGFLAVFVAAIGLRSSERGHDYHRVLHAFAGEVEQVMTVLLLVLVGGAATTGLLSSLSWSGAAVGVALILVVRPIAGAIGLLGMPVTRRERRAIAFFGIRGVGSIYYLAFALGQADFSNADELWSITLFTILLSIVIHGVTATPIMERLDRRRRSTQLGSSAKRG